MLDKLKAEGPGILAWLVKGCLQWQEEGLKPPESVRIATAQYRREQDLLQQFLDARCVVKTGEQVQSAILYEAYKTWCSAMEIQAMSGVSFGIEMKQRFDFYEDRRRIFYVGLSLFGMDQSSHQEEV